MKRFFITVTFIIPSIVNAQSSDSLPFVEEGKVWHYQVSNPSANPEYYAEWLKSYHLTGDTIIGPYKCVKLYVSCNQPGREYEWCYQGALFERNSKVFHIFPMSNTPYLLYDFNCQKGDRIFINGAELIIFDRRELPYNGMLWIMLSWTPKEMDLFKSVWLKGIGSYDNDLINYVGSWNPGSYVYNLLSCEVKGEEIFDSETFQRITVKIHNIYENSQTRMENNWYNLGGHKFPNKPSKKGIYIQNGKKVAIK